MNREQSLVQRENEAGKKLSFFFWPDGDPEYLGKNADIKKN